MPSGKHLAQPALPSERISAPVERDGNPAANPSEPDARQLKRDLALVTGLACVASVASFLWFFRHGQILLYGDAVAHINIARRVVDSRTPGPLQLGTVWLPLPHLLTLPFIVNDWLWRSGVGGSITSMLAYVCAVAGTFRLARASASRFSPQQTQRRRLPGTPRFAAWLAAGLLGLNPNLLYMQATAMTETLFLATLIWAIVYFDEFLRGLFPAGAATHICQQKADVGHSAKSLERCAVVLAAAMLTRYDGWVLALVIGCASAIMALRYIRAPRQPNNGAGRATPTDAEAVPPSGTGDRGRGAPANNVTVRRLLRSLAAFVLLCALVPALWLAHNYAINGKPLDWWNGPYSAKAIEQRNVGEPPHPGSGSVRVSALYFVKAAKLNFAQGRWQGWMLALAVFGTLSHGGPLLLLWLPLPFYAYAIAYGSVPIFLPVWYPFSYYNARYGLELLPAFAVFAALAVAFVYELSDRSTSQLFPRSAPKDWARDVPPQQTQKRHLLGTPDLGHPNPHGKWGTASAVVATALVIMLAANYLRIAGATPICLREARANSAARLRLQAQLAETLRRLPPGSIMLMYTGEYVGALQAADVPLRRVVSEATEATELVWDAGLSCPAQVADYVVAIGGDPVAEAVKRNPRWLEKVAAFSTPGKPDVTVYRSRFPGRRSISDF